MAICRVCNEILTDENTYESDRLNQSNICKKCHNKQNSKSQNDRYNNDSQYRKKIRMYHKNWRKKNPMYYQNISRTRRLYLGNGKSVRVNKRPYPATCEMCGKPRNRYVYHHWDDEDPSKGIWVCCPCHSIAELTEQGKINGLIEQYLKLKKQVEENHLSQTLK